MRAKFLKQKPVHVQPSAAQGADRTDTSWSDSLGKRLPDYTVPHPRRHHCSVSQTLATGPNTSYKMLCSLAQHIDVRICSGTLASAFYCFSIAMPVLAVE